MFLTKITGRRGDDLGIFLKYPCRRANDLRRLCEYLGCQVGDLSPLSRDLFRRSKGTFRRREDLGRFQKDRFR
jgi:hypothetical protein